MRFLAGTTGKLAQCHGHVGSWRSPRSRWRPQAVSPPPCPQALRHGLRCPRTSSPRTSRPTPATPRRRCRQASGDKYLTLAFIQTPAAGLLHRRLERRHGHADRPSTYGSDIATIRAARRRRHPVLRRLRRRPRRRPRSPTAAPTSARSPPPTRSVITTYNVTRIDLDIEDNSLTNTAGIDRRNKAIGWSRTGPPANGRTVQFVYTLPHQRRPAWTSTGAARAAERGDQPRPHRHRQHHDVRLLRRHHRTRWPTTPRPPPAACTTSCTTLYPPSPLSSCGHDRRHRDARHRRLRRRRDLHHRRRDARGSWAVAKGIGELSFWALERDNGGCPGTGGSDTCSGIAQSTWDFSHTFEPFTRR